MHLTRKDGESQGLLIKRMLVGKAYEAVMSLQKDVIRGPKGGEEVLKKLDELFQKEQVWDNYDRLSGYLYIRRKKDESVRDYLSRYEFLEAECRKTGNSSIEGELRAVHLLESAGFAEQEENMIVSACGQQKLEFDLVRKTMKRIFDNVKAKKTNEEEAWIEGQRKREFRREYRREPIRNANGKDGERKNPVRYGRVSTCAICGSEYHWARMCPKNIQNRGSTEKGTDEKVFASCEVDKEYWGDVEAILDTGCKSSLIGQI